MRDLHKLQNEGVDLIPYVLKDTVDLIDCINTCPPNCRRALIDAELQRRNYPKNERLQIMELHWLNINDAMKRTRFKGEIDPYTQIAARYAYQLQQEGVDLPSVDDKDVTKLIQSKQELLFCHHLQQSILNALQHHQADIECDFSIGKIIKEASEQFKRTMVHAQLYQFEIQSLVRRYAHLLELKDTYNHQGCSNRVKNEIVPELQALSYALKLRGEYAQDTKYTNEYDFKTNATQHLFEDLDESLGQDTSDTIKKHVTKSGQIPVEFTPQYSIEGRSSSFASFITYFSNTLPRFLTVETYFQQSNSEVKKILDKAMNPPEISQESKIEETRSTQLIELRKAISHCKAQRTTIEREEQRAYSSRSNNSIQRRTDALASLEYCANHASVVSPELKRAVLAIINEIKACEPSWRERRFLESILVTMSCFSFCTTGIATFHTHESLRELDEKAGNLILDGETSEFYSENTAMLRSLS